MSTLNELTEKRQSIRKYDSAKAVTREQLEQLVRCAQMAPSWKNRQATRYHVASTPEAVEATRKCLLGSNYAKTEGVGALVVVTFVRDCVGFSHPRLAVGTADKSKVEADNELGNGWGCFDAGAQSMLLQLKASEIGLDTLVIGIRDADALRQTMNIPEEETVTAVIAVGHRAEQPTRPPRRPMEEIAAFL